MSAADEGQPDDEALPSVAGHDETAEQSTDVERWRLVAEATLLGEGVERGHLDLVFVDADAMAELNETHMGHSGPTDVLSFPLDGPEALTTNNRAGGAPIHLGDVVICPTVAVAQAPEHCGSLDAELTLLVVHGVLHVLGHDHAVDAERIEMQARERHHLAAYGHVHPEGVVT